MANHAARDHARWSASATERNWNCPGALALTDSLPERTNPAADWGTACHECAEICLREGSDASALIGTIRKGKEHSFEVDDEMADTAQMFIDYVRQIEKAAFEGQEQWFGESERLLTLVQIEQHFSLASLNPPFEAGGTADAVVYFPAERRLEVVDLKGGRGHVVEAEGNPQLRTYALGAMLANSELLVEQITVTIVQPRAPHKSGQIRSETFHVADLMEWTADLMRAMGRSYAALAERSSMDGPPEAVWQRDWLKAGDHCKFCKAAGFCPTLQQKAYDAAGVWFDDLDKPRLANAPDAMSPEALAQALNVADMLGDWINAVRAYAHAQAETGVEIPDHMLVDRIGHRKWKQADEQVAWFLSEMLGVDPYARKVVSPAQAEKLLGAKRKSEIADLIERPVNGTNLVRSDKTTRPAVKPSVHQHFDIID